MSGEALLSAVAAAAREADVARRKLDAANDELAAAIRAACPTWSYLQVANSAGLSKSRVHQIVQEGAET